MAFLENDGVRLFFSEMGGGRPLVFLHGWGMSGRVWRFQHDFAESCRLIFVDLRGHGQSSAAESYSIDDYAADVEALFERLDLRDAVLVGWSMGSQVALQAFSALRSRVAGMVVVGATSRFTTAPDYVHGKPPQEVKGMGLRLRRDYQKTMGDFFKGMFAEGEMDNEQYQRIVHEIVMGGHSPNPDAVLAGLRLLDSVDLRSRLPEIDCPALLVHGDQDTICPVSASEYLAERLPKGELRVMAGCGHAPFMTRPAEFNAVVREFLTDLR